MVRRLIKDESGATMGLAVIMIVLIGVMGAGLLTFVATDLTAVAEASQGQKAFEMADAGVEAAKNQLKLDARPELYNGNGGDIDGDGEDTADSEWSCSWNGSACTGAGKTLDLDGNGVTVGIQYLTPSENSSQVRQADRAPEVLPRDTSNTTTPRTYPNNRVYFKITAQGTAGGAQRRIEAIYRTKETGFPTAYYATGDINWNGDAFEVANVSVFSKGSVTRFRPENLKGCDAVYTNWNKPPWNNKSRNAGTRTCTKSDGTSFTGVPTGVGAEGTINYQSNARTRLGTVDYDETTNPRFVPNTWTDTGGTQGPIDISYPFDPDPNTQVDLQVLRTIAESGQNGSRLVTKRPGESFNLSDYPSNSSANTVYFIEFVNADGTYTNASGVADPGRVNYTSNATNMNGTIVVVNGNFDMSGDKEYKGIIVLRDPIDDDNVTLQYRNQGNVKMEGFANVEGNITIGDGNVVSTVPDDVIDSVGRRPGFYILERWSWRECYNTACN